MEAEILFAQERLALILEISGEYATAPNFSPLRCNVASRKKEKVLLYFHSEITKLCIPHFQHDVHRKPQGIIALDANCRISCVDGSNTFEIATADKTHYLTADSRPIMEEWVRVLQNVIQRNALKLLLSREDRKPTLEGWVIKVKNGHAKKSWCVLLGTMFVYFKNQGDHVSILKQ